MTRRIVAIEPTVIKARANRLPIIIVFTALTSVLFGCDQPDVQNTAPSSEGNKAKRAVTVPSLVDNKPTVLNTEKNNENSQKIILQADEWCPYNCTPNTELQGYQIDIIKAALEPHGYTIDYQVTNWSRAVHNAKIGKTNGIIGALKGDAEGFVFPNESLGITTNSLWAQVDSTIEYKNINSLAKLKIGLIQGYSYGENVDNYVETAQNNTNNIHFITGIDALSRNILSIEKGRIDGTIEDYAVMQFHLQNSLPDTQLKLVATLNQENVYIAFSPQKENSQALANLLSNAIAELRKSGELAAILAKYNLKDWK